ncbi:hypothetical protein G8C92_03765 [Paenibacillus donghaensis]|uniref:hypothetical protein n=1 Tax=Paenibacillus donghaensis TaxID=414771 RepID=UPI001884143D|nr:hypothetical protein [Paenibacillus donghaensis]MBE9913156.1 hypothetical protein [Paenibacillus donghaensis]
MFALTRFLLQSYTRKHAYFAAFAATLISMGLIYSYKPNPVMDSYAVTSVFLFVGSAWIALSFLNHAGPQQEQLHMIHIGSMRKYLLSQITALIIPVILLTFIFILYPIVFRMFGEPVRFHELMLAICGHLVMGILGFALALFCQKGLMANGTRATSILLILIIVSIAAKSLTGLLPEALAWLRWILPPVSLMMNGLMNSKSIPTYEVWGTLGYGLFYFAVLVLVYTAISVRRDART